MCLQSQRCFHLGGVKKRIWEVLGVDVRFGLNLQNKQSNVPITVEIVEPTKNTVHIYSLRGCFHQIVKSQCLDIKKIKKRFHNQTHHTRVEAAAFGGRKHGSFIRSGTLCTFQGKRFPKHLKEKQIIPTGLTFCPKKNWSGSSLHHIS